MPEPRRLPLGLILAVSVALAGAGCGSDAATRTSSIPTADSSNGSATSAGRGARC